MRPSNKQRSRNKPGNNGNQHNNQQRRPNMGNIINRVFESAGPDGKVRGTPQQIIDKYQMLARDAQLAGDRVAAESYLQHAEHYSRLLGDAQRQQQETTASTRSARRASGRGGRPREESRPPRFDDGFEPERRQPATAQPVASGLAMIEPDDSLRSGRADRHAGGTAGRRADAGGADGLDDAADAAAPGRAGQRRRAGGCRWSWASRQAQPAKRSRPRRRSKPAAEGQVPEPPTRRSDSIVGARAREAI